MPDGLLYRRCRKPLVQEIDSLRRIGKAERIDYYILDSVGYGTAGDPAAADAALDFGRAVGQLGTGAMALAHITKNGDDNDRMPYGSMFWHASARCTYFLKVASEEGDTRTIGAFNRKRTMGRPQAPLGLLATFGIDHVSIDRTDITEVQELAAKLPLWQRIQAVLKAGPQTLATIARELGHENTESIDRTVRRHKGLFTKVTGSDGIARVALVENGRHDRRTNCPDNAGFKSGFPDGQHPPLGGVRPPSGAESEEEYEVMWSQSLFRAGVIAGLSRME